MEDNRQEDLDLLLVFKSIKKGIINLFKSIVHLMVFSFKHFVIVGVFILIFTAIGYGIYSLRKPYYKSEMSVSHVRFENDYCKEMINNLNLAINPSNDNRDLGTKLGMNKDYAKLVKCVSYKSLNEQIAKLYADSISVMLPFKVEAEVYATEIFDTLQEKIIAYLEANEYANLRKQFDKQALVKIEQRLDNEIERMDSLKGLVEKSIVPQSKGNGIILGEPINPVLVYEAVVKLYEKKLEVNEKQHLNDSFKLMVGFSSGDRAGPGQMLFILAGALLGYIIGLIVASNRSSAK
jgi:hypothetical protein